MSPATLAWIAIGLYAAFTAFLAWRGWRASGDMRSFAVGSGRISPVVVGLSLAAQLTSVATFVVNPGLVHAYGLPALLGLGVAAALGITVGLVVFSRAFRRGGDRTAALTVPQWIGARFGSKGLSVGFGLLSLALVTYAVLIVVALAWVLHLLVGLSPALLAGGLVVFVFGYVAVGGASTHAWTNAVQAGVMVLVAIILLVEGLPALWEGPGLFASLSAQDPALVGLTNPSSPYFRTLFEVFGANFLVGLALVCQPHVLSKALYLRSEGELWRYLGTAIVVGTVFMGVMWVGLFARLDVAATTPIDQVVPTWIALRFGPAMRVVVSMGLIAAGISTLEGIVLALSTITSVDLLPHLAGRWLPSEPKARSRVALRVGRGAIAVAAGFTWLLALGQLADPTGGSVAIFAQYGVYAVITGSFVPLAAGMFLAGASKWSAGAGAITSVGAYLLAAATGFCAYCNNPAFLASVGMAAGWAVFAAVYGLERARVEVPGTVNPSVDI